MAKVAVLVDLSFFLKRYNRVIRKPGSSPDSAKQVAKCVWDTAIKHIDQKSDELYRILVYDCRPFSKKVHNPVTGRPIDFAKSDEAIFRRALNDQLKQKRKLALRLGDLKDGKRWQFHERVVKGLLNGTIDISKLSKNDVFYDMKQKGVDIKIGIDIASLALKKLVDRIILITGDADFVPAAKLARREGIDIVLDPLWNPISSDLHEHIDGLKSVWKKPRGK
jgi:uncharacterized LabA/DUF88 family protein